VKLSQLDRSSLLQVLLHDADRWKDMRDAEPDFVIDLHSVDLHARDLSFRNLTNCQLAHGNLMRADLTGAQFTGAHLNSAYLSGATCHNTIFHGADANLANFDRADLTHANFAYAWLSGARFTGADLTQTDFTYAHLERANISRSCVHGADFTGAHLDGILYEFLECRRDQPFYKLLPPVKGHEYVERAVEAFSRIIDQLEPGPEQQHLLVQWAFYHSLRFKSLSQPTLTQQSMQQWCKAHPQTVAYMAMRDSYDEQDCKDEASRPLLNQALDELGLVGVTGISAMRSSHEV